MLAVVFPHPGAFDLADVPRPAAAPGQVVVRVRSTTLCATDFKVFHGQYPGVRYPHIPGHEWGGEVAEVGAGVAGLEPGDKVGVEAHVGCGACPRCAEGLYNLCEAYGHPERGHAHIGFTVPGGLAEYCAIPARAAHRLPEPLDCDHGAFTDTVGIALWAFDRAGGVRGGETVAVVGPGALGLLAVQIARALGAGQVIAVGAPGDAERLHLAARLGASQTLASGPGVDVAAGARQATAGRGADLVIEFAGTAEAGREAIEMARRGGRVVLGGATSPGRRLEVDLSTIVRGHLDVLGTMANPRGVSGRANTLMQRGLVDVRPLMTHRLPLAEFGRAWELFRDRQDGVIRAMLHP
jgi:threonine dehydrogenase-like Zn-dependent dehydrogenase